MNCGEKRSSRCARNRTRTSVEEEGIRQGVPNEPGAQVGGVNERVDALRCGRNRNCTSVEEEGIRQGVPNEPGTQVERVEERVNAPH